MKITHVIWLKQFSDKIESKHAVSRTRLKNSLGVSLDTS